MAAQHAGDGYDDRGEVRPRFGPTRTRCLTQWRTERSDTTQDETATLRPSPRGASGFVSITTIPLVPRAGTTDPMRLSQEIANIQLQIGPHRVQLIDAINDWSDRVLKLLFDSRQKELARDGSTWSLYDLVGSLIRRDAIEVAIREALGVAARISILKAADELFRSFTREIEIDVALLAEENPEPHDAHWWWNRIPSSGPLAEEISTVIETYFRGGAQPPPP